MSERLGDLGKRLYSETVYSGHQNKKAKERADHLARIDSVRRTLKSKIIELSTCKPNPKSQMCLMQVSGCVRIDGPSDAGSPLTITCPDCITFKRELEAQNLRVWVSETKYHIEMWASWD